MASSTSTRKTRRNTTARSTASKGAAKAGAKGQAKGRAKAGDKGGAKGGAKAAGGRSPAASGGRAPRGAGSDGGGGIGGAFREHLGDRKRDAGGLALVVLGILAGLGTYADAAGPVGAFLEAVALGLFGLAGYLFPIVLTWFGLLVVVGRPSPEIGRIAVGCVVLLAGLLGALHLLAASPDPSDGMRALWRAGGLLGWLVGTPLAWALSVWGAAAVLTAVITLGLLVVTRTPFSVVIDAIRDIFRPASTDDVDVAPARAPSRRTTDDTVEQTATSPVSDDEHPTTPIRATLAAKSATQPPIDGVVDPITNAPIGDDATDQPANDRVPDPPIERARVPAAAATGKAAKVAPVKDFSDYQLPSLDLLAHGRSVGADSTRTIEAQVAALQETFDQFGIDATVARHSRGPTVTRFEIELGPGVQVKKVANMGDDIAYALAAPDVRIVAPIPGKSAIGVEVPNRQRDLITLGDILRSPEAQADPHPLTVALGVDIAGKPELINLATMPHLLVSGATGSGKSVTLNGMIHSLIMRTRPDEVRMILIDPKRVELNAYQGAPHLLSPVVTDPRRAADAVQWCVKEMEQRYELLAHLGFRNIDSYNDALDAGEVEPRPGPDGTQIEPTKLPYILLVIDELADLMLVAPRDVEDAICRIAQMARAVGIHMIIATQRPSVDVITGLIKANIPSRLALAVASQTDSRTIIDMNGAEKLVGKGDMLFLPASQGKPSRLQGCWVTEREITTAVEFCRQQREPEFEPVVKQGEAAQQVDAVRSGDDDSDEALLRRAAEQVVTSGLGSTSMLQRKLRIGFARAGRLMDELEELGVVGPNEGSKARDVLWEPEQLDEARASGVL
ncbi:MAG: DNA translocase FtsK [Nitriliruptoraceae bacterium]|nr:DNA translocase FtsK [Nitriliruptoraceae bacterium]